MATYCWKFWKFSLKIVIAQDRTAARGTITWKFLQQKFVIHFFASSKKLTIHRKPQLIFSFLFILKSQQKVDVKLSKICQSHQKLSEWQTVASRFTEIVVRKCRRRFNLFVGLLDSLIKQGTTGKWILMIQMLATANSAWVCWLCCLSCCSGNYTVKHKRVFILSGWTVR